MNRILLTIYFVTLNWMCFAQNQAIQTFLMQVDTTSDLKAKVDLLAKQKFVSSNPDSAFSFAQQGIKLAQSIGYKNGEMNSLSLAGFASWAMGDFETAINLGYQIREYALSVNDSTLLNRALVILRNSYRDLGDGEEAFKIYSEQKKINRSSSIELAAIYYAMTKYDSAMHYLRKSQYSNPRTFDWGWPLLIMGRTWEKLNNDSLAIGYYQQSIKKLKDNGINQKDFAGACNSLASLFNRKGFADSAIHYANEGLKTAQEANFYKEKTEAYQILFEIFEQTNKDAALTYLKQANAAKDSLFNQEKQRRITSFRFNEELRQQEIKAAELEFKNKSQQLWIFSISGAFFSVLLLAFILFRNNQNKQKAKQKIEKAYDQLKSTQTQLIQSEKMASLGELTAGIAHEIQNPLNFVNNFSEVSNELIGEMNEELEKGDINEAKEIGKDIDNNLGKINHHGKRAEAIVKGMLQHSRTSAGEKELTDINKLADEYLRLAYHGLRAKDKSFNADFKMELDESLPKINVIPQDIGRVLLNLINNAFYACAERSRSTVDKKAKEIDPLTPKGGTEESQIDYKPEVIISTSSLPPSGGMRGVKVVVTDNGPGIPDEIKDKIFQPFFTTKPTGSGTGLGLSLSYDIVKAHGGEITVESLPAGEAGTENIGTEFIISIPIQS